MNIESLMKGYGEFLDKDKTQKDFCGTDREIWDSMLEGFLIWHNSMLEGFLIWHKKEEENLG